MFHVLLLFVWCVGYGLAYSAQILQHKVNEAVRNSLPRFEIPAGTYDFGASFLIKNAQNFSLVTDPPVTLRFTPNSGIVVHNCSSTRVGGFTVEYPKTLYSQGIVTKIIPPRGIEVKVDTGFPVPDKTLDPLFDVPVIKTIWYNPTTKNMVTPQINDFMRSSTPLNNNTYRIQLRTGHDIANNWVRVGDVAAIVPRVGHVYACAYGQDVVTENITYYNAPNVVFAETGGEGGNTYRNLRIIRKPNRQPFQYHVGNMGGFNLNGAVKAATVENCYFEHIGDDMYNVHDLVNPVVSRLSDTHIVVAAVKDTEFVDMLSKANLQHHSGPLGIRVGSEMYFYQPVTETSQGSAKVKSWNQTTDPKWVAAAAKIPELYEKQWHFKLVYGNHGKPWKPDIYIIEFSTPVSSSVTELSWANFNLVEGAVIRGNTFVDGYVTMAKIKSHNAICEGNYFAYPHQGAVVLESDEHFLEGNVLQKNITIINNTFCGFTEKNITVAPHSQDITIKHNVEHCREE